MVVDQLVPPELLEEAQQRRLDEMRGARIVEHRDQHVRGPIPRLPGVEIALVVVERCRRGEDRYFASWTCATKPRWMRTIGTPS